MRKAKATTPVITKGYKATLPDGKNKYGNNKINFKVGETYEEKGKLQMCANGFHFCIKAGNVFDHYSFEPDTKVYEIEAYGEVIHDEAGKSCCLKIKIIRQLDWAEVLLLANDGLHNTGHSNSGDSNSGSWNSGDRNSGDRNSGDRNSGDSNSGYSNSGYRNSGYRNSGDRNSGDRNSGDRNSGDRNSGDSNSGYRNSGYRNSGDRNSGYRNSGDRNSGSWNSGDRNSGDSNSGYRNSGAFCTDKNPKLKIFDKECDMTVREWENHECLRIMNSIEPCIWVPSSIMSPAEKKANPKYETTEGYLKKITMHEAWANTWHNLSDAKKKLFFELPNFDAVKFEEITGIKVLPY